MRTACIEDRKLVVDILSNAFVTNQSVNYIVRQDRKKLQRIRALMDYSFEVCFNYGKVFISDDEKGCALVLFPDKKTTTVKSILLDAQLILRAIGIINIRKALRRESRIKKIQPKDQIYYLWFIGVQPEFQGNGIGSKLLKFVMEDSTHSNRPIILETSVVKNLPWYRKMGFQVYHELDLSYTLFFLKRNPPHN